MTTLILGLNDPIPAMQYDDMLFAAKYGSVLYGTATELSDADYVVIVKDMTGLPEQIATADGKVDISLYSDDDFVKRVKLADIMALEVAMYMSDTFTFTDHAALRSSISQKASHSYVKAKKKYTVEDDAKYAGIKSLFHSFRIPMFGIQIATEGRITDFTSAASLWHEELLPHFKNGTSWEELHAIYKPRHNALMTEFRNVCSK